MYGAILGDIIGSQYEWTRSKRYDFPLFTDACHFTDDSLTTLAVAEALALRPGRWYEAGFPRFLVSRMVRFGRDYPDVGWGDGFYRFLTEDPTPYGSFGNGAAMRVSPVGWVAEDEAEVRELSRIVTEVSHDHPDAVLAAEAVARAIYLGRTGASISKIRARMEEYYPALREMTIEEIRPSYEIDLTCEGSVPQAILAALEAQDFADAVRTAVSLGGDADTQGAIAGSIAEAIFGIPDELLEEGLSYLDEELEPILYAFDGVRLGRENG